MKKIPRLRSNCLNCKMEILYLPSQRDGKYCSQRCHSLHKSFETYCKECRKIFKVPNARKRQNKGFYCSTDCYYKAIFRGGKSTTKDGYIRINKTKKLEHRTIMEKHLGRSLKKTEEVHHKNGIKNDNRLKNLEIVLNTMHFGKVECPHCLKSFKVK